ncbi:hypothetical protein AA0313_2833 [Acetobacter indonesiensis NRIC 0313]|uniref:Uncharacterized protein n=1 Tax=Acetobacter indonesiensis TaxID=104101 RepID=A0A6N3T8F0_9PROT|nr:hypothetical protein [Acetobacter indonesiensis]GAN63294.1 hypothetical protein Abin_024_079 [Acetobacter indonesiensis]GBQ61856.1 hypothetical protein AA0313_2833 [Acetobacter indonesiensis NRIC 0313]GEN03877.1 hypothetical protein AIN02nite_19020 [Acetobacter indonesiensis]
MLFLVLFGFLVLLGLGVGFLGKIARIEDPASSVATSPVRSAVRATVFPRRDMTAEELDHQAELANIKADAGARESVVNAIQVAGSSSHKT